MAGGLWFAAGTWLCLFGSWMVLHARETENATFVGLGVSIALGLWLGWLKGKYVLGQTARRNLTRIRKLTEPQLWQFLGLRTTIVILVMIGFGRGLRALADAGYLGGYTVVSGVYLGIGVALLRSAFLYFEKPASIPPRTPEPRASGPQGILLVNLGTPNAPTTKEVRRYLRQFLSDPFVVEFPRVVWWFVLHVIILPFRSPSSAKLYRRIWTAEGSPIMLHGIALRDRLRETLGESYRVALGMRYGRPSMEKALAELEADGCREITLVSLFPQFSRSTTGSVQKELFRLVQDRRDPPAVRLLQTDPCEAGYIEACAAIAKEATANEQVDHWVFSFHGIPVEYEKKGDPYGDQCALSARAIAARLGLAREDWSLVFQSRFGPDPWLQPYADEYVLELAKKYERLAVLVPGFAADCLETLDEIAGELRDDFLAQGGEEMIVVPALNAHPEWVRGLTDWIRRETRA